MRTTWVKGDFTDKEPVAITDIPKASGGKAPGVAQSPAWRGPGKAKDEPAIRAAAAAKRPAPGNAALCRAH